MPQLVSPVQYTHVNHFSVNGPLSLAVANFNKTRFGHQFMFELGDVSEARYGSILKDQKAENFGKFPESRAKIVGNRNIYLLNRKNNNNDKKPFGLVENIFSCSDM